MVQHRRDIRLDSVRACGAQGAAAQMILRLDQEHRISRLGGLERRGDARDAAAHYQDGLRNLRL